MEFQGSPEDSTKFISMMDEYNAFLQRGDRRSQRGIRLKLFETEDRRPSTKLSDGSSGQSSSERREKEAELIAAKAKIIRLESELNSAHNERKRIRLESDSGRTDLKLKIQKAISEKEGIEEKLRHASETEDCLKDELQEAERQITVIKERFKEQCDTLMKENARLRRSLEETEVQLNAEKSELKEKLTRQCADLMSCKTNFEEAEAKIAQLNRKLNNMVSEEAYQAVRLELEKTAQRVKEVEEKYSRVDEGAKLSKKLQKDLSKIRELEKQNASLKEEVYLLREGSENNLLLQEKCDAANVKLRRAESQIKELQKFEIENERLKKKMDEWETEDETGAKVLRCPRELMNQISSLQKTQIALKEEAGQLIASKEILEKSLQNLLEKYRSVKDEFSVLKEKESVQANQTRGLKRKLFLVTAERDGMRGVLSSFDREISGQYDSQLVVRVEEAEERARALTVHSEQLEKELKECRTEVSQCQTKLKKLETELEITQIQLRTKSSDKLIPGGSQGGESRAQIERLIEENKKLEKRVLMLEAELELKQLKGCYDPSKTKVLHMAINPFSKSINSRKEELEKLKTENSQLKTTLANYQQKQGDRKSSDVLGVGVPISSDEAKELKAQLEKEQLRYKRLQQVYEERAQEFREACYQLLGYRIDGKGTSKYHLYPMYGESRDDFFIFKYDEGQLQMVETEFSKQCKDLVDMFLFRGGSIPAFLSSVTTELFARQTHIQDSSLIKK